MKTIIIKNKRLSKYLYSLGFDRKCTTENGIEKWEYIDSNELQESLEFYFNMRKRNRK